MVISINEYNNLPGIEKVRVIENVFDQILAYHDKTDHAAHDVVVRHWRTISIEVKEGWKVRTNRPNTCPREGQIECFPHVLTNDLKNVIRECLKLDTSKLHESFIHQMKKTTAPTQFSKRVKIPYSVKVVSQEYVLLSVPTLLLDYLFGTNLDKFERSEMLPSCGKKSLTFHLCSRQKIFDVLSFLDMNLRRTYDTMSGFLYSFTSYGIICHNGSFYKAYGWSELENTINWHLLFNGGYVKVPNSTKVFNEKSRMVGYSLGHCIDASGKYQLVEFLPCSITTSRMNILNFKMITVSICTNVEETNINIS